MEVTKGADVTSSFLLILLGVKPKIGDFIQKVLWLILCVSLTRPWGAPLLIIALSESMQVFLDEMKIWTDRLSKSDDPPRVSRLTQWRAWVESGASLVVKE